MLSEQYNANYFENLLSYNQPRRQTEQVCLSKFNSEMLKSLIPKIDENCDSNQNIFPHKNQL